MEGDTLDDWPAFPNDWGATRTTLHLVSQMLGKVKLALMPPQPEWLHTGLLLDARGFSTGPMPYGSSVVGMGLDVFDGAVRLARNDGRQAHVDLGGGRSIAVVWKDVNAALASLDLPLDLWDKPQEVADVTPLSRNSRDGDFVPEQAQRFHRVLSSANAVFEEFRSTFFGRSAIRFWWGSFDLSVLLFNGRHATPPPGRGHIMRYDLDAEHLSGGLWAGDESTGPTFYAYLVPRPDGCESAPVQPAFAAWVEEMGEWVMPYEAVRTCGDPRRALLEFFSHIYQLAVTMGGWDAAAHTYVRPPAPGSERRERRTT